MTALAFIVTWLLQLAWYSLYGARLWSGGPTCYMTSMFVVLCVTAWFARKESNNIWAVCLIAAMIVFGQVSWSFDPTGFVRMALHLVIATVLIYFGTRFWQYVLGYIFLLGSLISSLNILGAFPPRPRVFTGFYYADIVAYLTYAMLITVGCASGDMGPFHRLLLVFRTRSNPGLDHGALSRMEEPCEAARAVGDR